MVILTWLEYCTSRGCGNFLTCMFRRYPTAEFRPGTSPLLAAGQNILRLGSCPKPVKRIFLSGLFLLDATCVRSTCLPHSFSSFSFGLWSALIGIRSKHFEVSKSQTSHSTSRIKLSWLASYKLHEIPLSPRATSYSFFLLITAADPNSLRTSHSFLERKRASWLAREGRERQKRNWLTLQACQGMKKEKREKWSEWLPSSLRFWILT